ncbi:MAG: DNA adenine methylase [Candidatus Gracilibacteria bacterium]|nr:DNA adenine methylase [Candidatus Gracilibacteria bacterium]
MTTIALQSLKFSIELGIDFQKVKSWLEHMNFLSELDARAFFIDNKDIINAKPFVKWVGGKRQLIEQFKRLFPTEYNNYFEPFLGGGAVFFNLQKEKSFLSDVNAELINLYQVIKAKPMELIKFLEKQEVSKERFEEIRAWDRLEGGLSNFTNIERAGRFIYMNRTCFNGLYRVNSKGQFNVPFGKYSNPDIVQRENILNASKLLNKTKAEIKLQSFEKVLDKAQTGDFVYFDPPYDVLTESANFTSYNESGFGRDLQTKLRDIFVELDKRGCKVMLSNHNTPFIRDLFEGYRFEIVKANRMINSKASGRGKVEEIVVMNYTN